MSVQFKDTEASLSQTLADAAQSITSETISLRQLFEMIGEQGLLLFCIFLTIPFLIPVSIPGVSTVFGAAIILIGIGIFFNRIPWLPKRLLDRPLETKDLIPTLQKGAALVGRMERFIRPRLQRLTDGALMNRVNAAALTFSGVLLIFPLGLIPFSNTLPGLAIMLLSIGIIQRDGLFILAGYLMIVATVIYFGALALGALLAGQGLMSLIGSG